MSHRKFIVNAVGFTELEYLLSKINENVDDKMSLALYEGAKVVANATKPLIPVQTGGLQSAYGIANFAHRDNEVDTKIGFGGRGMHQYKNGLKSSNYAYSYIANTLINGSSRAPGLKKQNFINSGLNKSKAAAESAIQTKLDEELQKLIKENGG